MSKTQRVDSSVIYSLAKAYADDYFSWAGCTATDDFKKYTYGSLRSRNLKSLCSLSASDDYLQALHAGNVRLVRFVLQFEAFFKKNASLTGSNTEQTAMETFHACELSCEATNKRLDLLYSYEPDRTEKSDAVTEDEEKVSRWMQLVSSMSKDIRQMLGSYKSFERKLPSLVRVTSGATASLPRKNALPFKKVSQRIPCSPRLIPRLEALAKAFGYESVEGIPSNVNRVTTVPKNWKTDRTIACEPTGNIPFQLAFDTYVKSKLLSWEIDLSDQSKNQRYAHMGSNGGFYATIDLQNASDTLAQAVVALLLPEDWYSFVHDCRSDFYKLPDGSHGRYHKFSSMGNGCTFTLETLIFGAAIRALGVEPGSYAVYGDDLIVPTHVADDLISLLAFLGFTVNKDKTFITGSYRESCGEHYVNGRDVTPVFVRRLSETPSLMDLCLIINTLPRVADAYGQLWTKIRDLYRNYSDRLPLIPWNDTNVVNGVWIPIHMAYSKKVLRTTKKTGPWILMCKYLVEKTGTRTNRGERSLFLWYLTKLRLPFVDVVCSASTVTTHKYVLKWCFWVPSQKGTFCSFLTEWADFLLAKS